MLDMGSVKYVLEHSVLYLVSDTGQREQMYAMDVMSNHISLAHFILKCFKVSVDDYYIVRFGILCPPLSLCSMFVFVVND